MTAMKEKLLWTTILKEEIKINDSEILKCLNEKNIEVCGHYFQNKKSPISKRDIEKQIDLIIDIHKRIAGIKPDGVFRIESKIGKMIEEYKVQIKVLKDNYKKIIIKANKNDIDNIIISDGKKMLRIAEKVIDDIYNDYYYNIISRSMNRKEICIGRGDSSNLIYKDNKIYVGSIKNISYNLIEEDMYKYIKRLQKKDIKINVDDLINYFVFNSHLSNNSIKYLKNICIYPRDFLKNWEQYKNRKANKPDNHYIREFERALRFEDNSIY